MVCLRLLLYLGLTLTMKNMSEHKSMVSTTAANSALSLETWGSLSSNLKCQQVGFEANFKRRFFFFFLHLLFIYFGLYMLGHTYEHQISPTTMWIPGIELRISGEETSLHPYPQSHLAGPWKVILAW